MTPPAKRAKKTKVQLSPSHDTTVATGDTKMKQESSPESSSDSSDSNSDFSSEDGSSDVSDLGKFTVAILAQAAVSVQNPPSGSQTCFPGGWVR